ncbi:carboxylesterase family protein [Amycolatopsis sp. NPDC049253]|uniref:carboxylesterase family protein n=1 Tax=Amycolatopsis sp. NPDC049253 TaxID=3155274 RepID=UPI0034453E06
MIAHRCVALHQFPVSRTDWTGPLAAAFGGDPNNLTIFGESAGGMSACAKLTSPPARGLVDKAIMSSGPCRLSRPVRCSRARRRTGLTRRCGRTRPTASRPRTASAARVTNWRGCAANRRIPAPPTSTASTSPGSPRAPRTRPTCRTCSTWAGSTC